MPETTTNKSLTVNQFIDLLLESVKGLDKVVEIQTQNTLGQTIRRLEVLESSERVILLFKGVKQ